MTPFEAYQKYIALKNHFTSNYDYFKYSGKMANLSPSAFESRKDRMHFNKLVKKNKDVEDFLVANLFVNPDFWIGDVNTEQATKAFADMQRRQHSLSYMFSEEIQKIDNLKDWIRVGKGYPKLFMEYKRKNISPETLIIIDDCINIFDYWSKYIDDVVFCPVINNLRKYKPFIKYDKEKYKDILVKYYQGLQ